MSTGPTRSPSTALFVLGTAASMTVVVFACSWIFYSDRLGDGEQAAAFVGLLALLTVLIGTVTAIQAHLFGGWERRRSFTRAVSKDGVLPDDADPALWRPRLARLLALSSPASVRVTWTWFGIVLSVAPQVVRGHPNPIGLAILVVLGALIGLAVSWSVSRTSRRRVDNARRLIDQIDAKASA